MVLEDSEKSLTDGMGFKSPLGSQELWSLFQEVYQTNFEVAMQQFSWFRNNNNVLSRLAEQRHLASTRRYKVSAKEVVEALIFLM